MIAIGCDHGGYDLKEKIRYHLEQRSITYKDFGCFSYDSCDYPAYGKAVANAVASGECEKGIVICTTGIGIAIAANKVKGIRAATCTDATCARMTRAHNDANVLALGGGIIGGNLAKDIVDAFLDTPFSNEEKHIRRVNSLEL